jgi:hypothetical protein
MRFDLISQNGSDMYLTSAVIMNFLEVLDHLSIIEINTAYHSEGFLHVNIE